MAKNNYERGQAYAKKVAMEWMNRFANGETIYMSECVEMDEKLEKLAHRYGLVNEWRNEGIIAWLEELNMNITLYANYSKEFGYEHSFIAELGGYELTNLIEENPGTSLVMLIYDWMNEQMKAVPEYNKPHFTVNESGYVDFNTLGTIIEFATEFNTVIDFNKGAIAIEQVA